MVKNKDKDIKGGGIIVLNKCVCFEYYIDQCYEVGVVLQGWEFKVLCVGWINFGESFVMICDGEIFLYGVLILLLISVFIYVIVEDWCICKLLLYKYEIDQLIGVVECKGYIIVFIVMYWKGNKVKVEVGVVCGKQEYDKCDIEKECDWQCEKQCMMNVYNCYG